MSLPLVGGGAGRFAMEILFLDSSNDQERITCEALRQTEMQLEDLNQLATSADQRAMAFSATSGLLATLLINSAGEHLSVPWVYISCFGLVLSAMISIWSCMPRSFYIRGHTWKDWRGHIDDRDTYVLAVASQAAENDDRIQENFAALKRSGSMMKVSYFLAFYSILFLIGAELGGWGLSLSQSKGLAF